MRCAITNTGDHQLFERGWICDSVTTSTLLVDHQDQDARMIRSARAIAMRCFWPRSGWATLS
jgi:hypothetical protein